MSTEPNNAAAEAGDDRIDARIRALVQSEPAACGFAPKVLQRVQRKKRILRQCRVASVAVPLLVVGVSIWRFSTMNQSETDLGKTALNSPDDVPEDNTVKKFPSGTGTANNSHPLLMNETTAGRLLSTPPPVTRLDVIDEHQSALLAGLQTMLDEER